MPAGTSKSLEGSWGPRENFKTLDPSLYLKKKVCTQDVYHYRYAVLRYRANELSRIDISYVTSHERASDHFASVYRVYFESIFNILIWICEEWSTW
jgi:hypothetical protein